MRKGAERTISSQNKYRLTLFNSFYQENLKKAGIFFTPVSYILIWDFGKALFHLFYLYANLVLLFVDRMQEI
jgi:hypothetical protein